MSVGDSHTPGPDGWPLCGASGPVRGYNATSPQCRDCDAVERKSSWTVAAPPAPARPTPPRILLRPVRLVVPR